MPNCPQVVAAIATVVVAVDALGGPAVSPMFDQLAAEMRTEIA